jgi:septal ring factor EnvC (AmiA/AmiB activator)
MQLLLIGCLCLGVSAYAQQISRDDLRKTVLHIQALAHEQAVQLAEAKAESADLQQEVFSVKAELDASKQEVHRVQAQIDKLNAYAQSEHKAHVEAEQQRDRILVRYHRIKLPLVLLGALVVAWALNHFASVLMIPPQYRLMGAGVAGVAVAGALFALL